MNFRPTFFSSLSLIFLLSITACSEDSDDAQSGQSELRIHLTDAPANYKGVYVDIQAVEVKIDDTSNAWQSLNAQVGIYNLLDFQNGLDTLIGTGIIPSGRLNQIRLIFGPRNSIVVGNDSLPLQTPSAQQSGLKLLVNYDLQAGLVYNFSLDFDAQRSIVLQGNGNYLLKPVIRVFTENTTGSIHGYLNPDSIRTSIIAYNVNGDTASTVADTNTGYFLLSGLPAASYTVGFNPAAPYPYWDTTNIPVNVGQVTNLDTTSL